MKNKRRLERHMVEMIKTFLKKIFSKIEIVIDFIFYICFMFYICLDWRKVEKKVKKA